MNCYLIALCFSPKITLVEDLNYLTPLAIFSHAVYTNFSFDGILKPLFDVILRELMAFGIISN